MNASIMIHGATSVHTDGVTLSNANAINLKIKTASHDFDVTLFDLPTAEANRIEDALGIFKSRLSEEEIRADERKKIAARLGVSS